MKRYSETIIFILFLPTYIALAVPVIIFTLQVFLFYPVIRLLSKNKNLPTPLKDSISFAKDIYKF